MKKTLLIPLLLSLCLASSAGAQSGRQVISGQAAPAKLTVPPVIAKMIQRGRGVTIVDATPVADTGLVAWVLSAEGETRIYYVTPDQLHVIYGLLFDGDLVNLTSRQISAYPPVATGPKVVSAGSGEVKPAKLESGERVASALRAAESSKEVLVEGSGKDVYVVFDPGCPYCHRLWLNTRGQKGARIHWLPVATATKKGGGLAQTIYESANRVDAMQRAATGSLEPSKAISADVTASLARNADVLGIAGKHNVPFILYKEGAQAYAYLGLPPSDQISRIFGAAR